MFPNYSSARLLRTSLYQVIVLNLLDIVTLFIFPVEKKVTPFTNWQFSRRAKAQLVQVDVKGIFSQ